jgi:hypothetical protein
MSTNATSAGAAGSARQTRFVLVNDGVPCGGAQCTLCGTNVDKGYVRDWQTRLIYCDTRCFAGHAKIMMLTTKSRARRVS